MCNVCAIKNTRRTGESVVLKKMVGEIVVGNFKSGEKLEPIDSRRPK